MPHHLCLVGIAGHSGIIQTWHMVFIGCLDKKVNNWEMICKGCVAWQLRWCAAMLMATSDVCFWQGPLCESCVSSHLKRHGDSQCWADIRTHLSWQSSDKGLAQVCVCVAVRGTALAKYNKPPTSQVISHRAKKPCKAAQPLPRSIVFAIRNTRRQNGSNELSFHTGTACRSLPDPIKTSQIHGYNCRMCLLQLNPYTAVLT